MNLYFSFSWASDHRHTHPPQKKSPHSIHRQIRQLAKAHTQNFWRHSMQRERPKAAKATSPIRRQEPDRFNNARNSARKNPNGTKAAMIAMLSTCICPLFWDRREKCSVRLYPEESGVIPQISNHDSRIRHEQAHENRQPPSNSAIVHRALLRNQNKTCNANDINPITTNAPKEHGKECRGRIPAKPIKSAQLSTSPAA